MKRSASHAGDLHRCQVCSQHSPANLAAAAGAAPPWSMVLPERPGIWAEKAARGRFVTSLRCAPPRGFHPHPQAEQFAPGRCVETVGIDAANLPERQSGSAAHAPLLILQGIDEWRDGLVIADAAKHVGSGLPDYPVILITKRLDQPVDVPLFYERGYVEGGRIAALGGLLRISISGGVWVTQRRASLHVQTIAC